MTKLEKYYAMVCSALGLEYEIGYIHIFANGKKINTVVRILNIGGLKGMLIVRSYEDIRANQKELKDYGWCVENESDDPYPEEEVDLGDLSGSIELFRDWGWAGESTIKPKWMI